MAFYGFKTNPRQLVINKAIHLFGKDKKVNATGRRPSPLECKSLGISTGTYLTECTVDGQIIASAKHPNWRKSYVALVLEVEKAYTSSLEQASCVVQDVV